MNWLRTVFDLPGQLIVLAVRIYQKCISPFLGRTCRFHPTCSEYFIQAVQQEGVFVGTWKGVRRICRCHPWNPGGYDPP